MAEKKALELSGDIRYMHTLVGFACRHEVLREYIRVLTRDLDVFAATMNKVEHMVRKMPDYEAKPGILGFVFRILPSCEEGKEMEYRLYARSIREREPTLRFIPITFSKNDGKIDTVSPDEFLQMPEMMMQTLVNDFERRRSAQAMDRIVAAAEKVNERNLRR